MPRGPVRQHWTWLALCAAPVAIGLAAIPASVHAQQMNAAQLRSAFDLLSGEASDLMVDLGSYRASLPPSFECPPAQPNKDSFNAELNGYAARLANLKRRQGVIDTQRGILGNAGEGQLGSGFVDQLLGGGSVLVTDAEMAQLRTLLTQIEQALQRDRNQLTSAPPSARDCNPPADPINAIAFNAPSKEPGENVRAQISATTASGKAVIIGSVTIAGINEVGAPAGVGGLGTANATYDFDIAKVRRQGPFTLSVTVTGVPAGAPAKTPAASRSLAVTYSVLNVAPRIETIPADPSAKPGDALTLQGQVVVVDRNADARNPGEIATGGVGLSGHPAGLETTPAQAFQRFTAVRLTSHDPATGRYVFDVNRAGTLRKPHAHGTFPTKVTVADRRGEKAQKDVTLIVENVAPGLNLRVGPPRNFHSGDGLQVVVAGSVSDDNGADDIEEIEVNALPAGGATYLLSAGSVVKEPNPTPTGFAFRIDPPSFGHTNNTGVHPITSQARDGGAPEQGKPAPLVANSNSDITVDNLAPEIGPIGFIRDAGPVASTKPVCPGDPITLGVLVRDPEGDALEVKAQIVETGATVTLQIKPGEKTHTGVIAAPMTPGQYTIRFIVTEVGVNKPNSVTSGNLPLTVVACGLRTASPGRTGVAPPGPASGAVAASGQGAGQGAGGGAVVITGAAGSQVKIGPAPPALPGEAPAYLPLIFDYARLLQMAAILDAIRKPGADASLPPLTQLVLQTFWAQYLLDQPVKVMEDGGNHPDGTCGTGNGEGPTLAKPDAAKGDAPQMPPFEYLKWGLSWEYDKAKQSGTLPAGSPDFKSGLDYKWQLPGGLSAELKGQYGDWVDTIKAGQGEAAPQTATPGEFGLRAGYDWRKADNWELDLGYEYNQWGKGLKLGNGALDLQPFAGFLNGLTLQEGHGEAAPQTILDAKGQGAVRYTTPAIAGFTLDTRFKEDAYWDAALRYAGEFGGFRIAIGTQYQQPAQAPAADGRDLTKPGVGELWGAELRYESGFGKSGMSVGVGSPFDPKYREPPTSVAPPPDSITPPPPETYFTPRFFGFKSGVTYTPQGLDKPVTVTAPPTGSSDSYLNDTWQFKDKWSVNLTPRYSDPAPDDKPKDPIADSLDEFEFSTRIKVELNYTGTTDGGLTFSGRINLDGGGPAHGGYDEAAGGSLGYDFGTWALTQGAEYREGGMTQGSSSSSTYLNDKWPLNDKLSFNLGLRYSDLGGATEDPCRVKKIAPVSESQGQ